MRGIIVLDLRTGQVTQHAYYPALSMRINVLGVICHYLRSGSVARAIISGAAKEWR